MHVTACIHIPNLWTLQVVHAVVICCLRSRRDGKSIDSWYLFEVAHELQYVDVWTQIILFLTLLAMCSGDVLYFCTPQQAFVWRLEQAMLCSCIVLLWVFYNILLPQKPKGDIMSAQE